jgi:pimeloyl-ACP methyl ester carboxylesterase
VPRLTALAVSVLLAVGILVVPTSAGPSTAAPPPASTVSWGSCADPELSYLGLQCGSLLVPLDHADPTGPKVRLALSRLPHVGSTYRGVMLVNPGGPGSPGRNEAAIGDYVPGGVGSSYDWIGFDPRGVAASSPALRCRRGYFGDDRPSYVPHRAWMTRFWIAKTRNYSAGCADTSAKRTLLRHLTTLDTVLDMESIRQALGATTLNYYGYSYGSYLGEVYATRFPSRVGRFVLDGVVNPSRVWYAANLDQDRAFNVNINLYFRYLAAHAHAFKLGHRWRAIRRGYYRELRRLARHPAVHGRLGPDELGDAMLDAAYYVYDWVGIGRAYSALVKHHRGGGLYARYRQQNPVDDNQYAVYNAVQCSDTPWADGTRTLRDARVIARGAPFQTWANTWYNAPCLSWVAPRHSRLAVSGGAVTARMLLINETRDAATPYAGALTVRRLFPRASLVAGLGGTTHASSLSGVPCVDNTVAAYLRSGVVPRRLTGTRADRVCPRVAPPEPFYIGSRLTGHSVDQMSPLLRRALVAAQEGR